MSVKKVSKKILAILMFLIIMMSFSGCVTQAYSLYLGQEGRAGLEIKVTMSRDSFSLLDVYNVDTENGILKKGSSSGNTAKVEGVFQEYAYMLEQEGFEIKPISDSVDEGFSATKFYDTPSELNLDLKNLYEKKLSGLVGEFQYSSNFFGDDLVFNGSLEYVLDDDITDEALELLMSEDLIKNNMTSLLTIKSDVPPVRADGERSDDKIVWTNTFDGKKSEPTSVILYGEFKNQVSLIIVGIGVVVLALIAFIVVSRISRKNKFNEAMKKNERKRKSKKKNSK